MHNTYLELLAYYGVGSAHPGGFALTRKIMETLEIDTTSKVVDLGCGTGETLAYIVRNYTCQVTGVDINKHMLSQAEQRLKHENLQAELVHADISQLPFPSNTFDSAISESVIIFTDINKTLEECSRVLKENGTFIAVEMSALYPLSMKELTEIKSVYGIEKVPAFDEWVRMLEQAGFTDIIHYRIGAAPTMKFTSSKMIYDFMPHINIMQRYGRRLGYEVFKCRCIKGNIEYKD
ncbi:MAG: methyltransferase domain-containing protein [Bacillota bacterium]|nr:methyltransferase domain-containing protein [Bacillota bacterium]